MNIRVDLNTPISDGMDLVFRSPVDCSQITGLVVYYKEGNNTCSKVFAFSDAHGNNVGDIPHLFAENVVVKVILDVTSGMAFVQNADTNAYIERTFVKTVNGVTPDENGNVEVTVSGGNADQGADGFSPIATVEQTASGAVISITDKNGTTTATITNGKDGATGEKGDQGIQGETGAKGDKGDTGANGKDGVSATHSWNGTVLTVTSASGTSSADLKGEPGKDGSAGSPGADGVSPTVAVSKSGKVTTISITDKSGTKTATINDGADGSAGSAGKDGTSVTVKSVSESTADGGSNVVQFSDGKTMTVKNGKTGANGSDATVTATNITSALGYTPAKQSDVEQKANKQGLSLGVGGDGLVYLFVDGAAQGNGLDIKAEAVAGDVVGYVDENNTIILTGALADGTYTFKYEDAEGNVTTVGDINVGNVSRYTNQIPISLGDDGSVYNGKGYKENTRYSASSKAESAETGAYLTGWIAIKSGDIIRLKNVPLSKSSSAVAKLNTVAFTDANKSSVWNRQGTGLEDNMDMTNQVFDGDNLIQFTIAGTGVSFIRITSTYIGEDSVITKNEEIV
jgi:hypothetical protein